MDASCGIFQSSLINSLQYIIKAKLRHFLYYLHSSLLSSSGVGSRTLAALAQVMNLSSEVGTMGPPRTTPSPTWDMRMDMSSTRHGVNPLRLGAKECPIQVNIRIATISPATRTFGSLTAEVSRS